MKKILSLLGGGALLLTSVLPALAFFPPMQLHPSYEKEINIANIDQKIEAISDTGGNTQTDVAQVSKASFSFANANSWGDSTINTGSARTSVDVKTIANAQYGCDNCSYPTNPFLPSTTNSFELNKTNLTQEVTAVSFTGYNSQDNYSEVNKAYMSVASAGSFGDRKITTGDAHTSVNIGTLTNVQYSYR